MSLKSHTALFKCFLVAVLILPMLLPRLANAHVDGLPSIHDVVSGIQHRLRDTIPSEELISMKFDDVLSFITAEEREALSTVYLTFEVNTPVVLSVISEVRLESEMFWLRDRNFTKTDMEVRVDRRMFQVWQKTFEAGHIGLGANSLSGAGEHYFVTLKPVDSGTPLEVTDIYPGQHTLDTLAIRVSPYTDQDTKVRDLPDELDGLALIKGIDTRTNDCQVVDLFRLTPYPASDEPDHIVLTWSDDPKTTQTIQWRTSAAATTGVVAYMKESEFRNFNPGTPEYVDAVTVAMNTLRIANDPVVHRHTAVLRDLEPHTSYVYAVGDARDGILTGTRTFTTAPDRIEPFSFIYMGDAQNGLERWGSLVQKSLVAEPDVAFYIMAGDLVNRGADRNDWDTYFENAEGVFDRKQLVPALGNHEYHGGNSKMYEEMFTLPESSPVGEKAYSFEYSNALFIVLDTNRNIDDQTEWLEEQLANTTATWKFLIYHHPAYSSSPSRDNPHIRKAWTGVFDKYHVDMALQGHDHAYLRTYPMKGEKPMDTPAEGTVYIVSVSGTKYYDQGDLDYKAFGMTNVSTYQTLDIQISGNRLVYRAYDLEGTLRDEIIIEK